MTHVWAEGATDAAARRLAQEYARRIRQLLLSAANGPRKPSLTRAVVRWR